MESAFIDVGGNPEDLSDKELYDAYQYRKEFGPVIRLDELQLEIAQRWEDSFRE